MAKKGFDWNRKRIAQAIGKVNAEFLLMAGAFVRNRARSPMKKGSVGPDGSRTHAPPGKAPYRYGNQLYDFMLYSFDPSTNSVVIGPKHLGGQPEGAKSVAHTLETGGAATVKVRLPAKPRNGRRWGPAHYAGTRPKLKKRLPDGTDTYRYFRSTAAHESASRAARFLAWCRAVEAENQPVTMRIVIEPRPFMTKALKQVLSEKVMASLYEKAAKKSYR